MDKNKRFAELAGLCWHEKSWAYGIDRLGHAKCVKCGVELPLEFRADHDNPDYAADPVLVLEIMQAREGWVTDDPAGGFSNVIGGWVTVAGVLVHWIFSEYCLNRTGKLRDLGVEFLERRR